MSSLLVHDMDTVWASLAPPLLQLAPDTEVSVQGAASMRLTAQTGATNAVAEFVPAVALDLNAFDELRFWVRAARAADGSALNPFFLEFSYLDANDLPGEEHRWFVPVNSPNRWEQRRIGIEQDRRGQITRLRFRCLTDLPFVCHLDELLAVREEVLVDVEQALTLLLDNTLTLPGLADIPLSQAANQNDTQIVLPLTRELSAGMRVRIQGGSAGDETHQVIGVAHNQGAGTTTLTFAAGDALAGNMNAGVARVTVLVPVFFESPPAPSAPPPPAPSIAAAVVDFREDLDRTGYFSQRDSFRPRGGVTVCSVRPAPRAYLVDYQLTALAPLHTQQRLIQTLLAQRLSIDVPLRINGAHAPVAILPPPDIQRRRLDEIAPLYVRIGTRMEVAQRREQTLPLRTEVLGAPADAPLDQEGIVIVL
jgi:hypothetical protein